MAQNIITEKYYYGPEAKNEFVYYDVTEKITECTGNLLKQAKERNWYASSKTNIVFKPLSEKEVTGLPQHFILNPSSKATVTICCEPVTIIELKDIFEDQDKADNLFANAYVWNNLPSTRPFVFPCSTGSIDTVNRNNDDGHALVGIATHGTQKGVMDISIWDPCGETSTYFKHAEVVAAAFNKMLTGIKFVAKTKWEGDAKEAMDCGPQVTYTKNGYCQTLAFIKIRDIAQNGFPGKLIKESDWKENYPTLEDLHRQSATLMYPSAPDSVTRNDLMPSAAGKTWMWMEHRYRNIDSSENQFAIMLPKERHFSHSQDDDETPPPAILASATTGGRALRVTLKTSLEWDDSSDIPQGIIKNPEFAEKVRNAATIDQHRAIMKKILAKGIEEFNIAALKNMFSGHWGGRWVKRNPMEPQRRIEIIRYVVDLSSGNNPEWDAEDAASFIAQMCNKVWGTENKRQTLAEFAVIEEHDKNEPDEDYKITEYLSENLLEKVSLDEETEANYNGTKSSFFSLNAVTTTTTDHTLRRNFPFAFKCYITQREQAFD